MELVETTMQAARPPAAILMTSLAFGMGVLPGFGDGAARASAIGAGVSAA
jgi:hypothetical protein